MAYSRVGVTWHQLCTKFTVFCAKLYKNQEINAHNYRNFLAYAGVGVTWLQPPDMLCVYIVLRTSMNIVDSCKKLYNIEGINTYSYRIFGICEAWNLVLWFYFSSFEFPRPSFTIFICFSWYNIVQHLTSIPVLFYNHYARFITHFVLPCILKRGLTITHKCQT